MVTDSFLSLDPVRLLDAVEAGLGSGARATGRCLALNSLENRVYEIELEERESVVAKFYRPGRWSRDSILDEHAFIAELAAAEIPAAAPLQLSNGSTLGEASGLWFALFPKFRGRLLPELDDGQLQQIGRWLARVHNVGVLRPALHRLTLTPEWWGLESIKFLLASNSIDGQLCARYERGVRTLVDRITPLFVGTESIRIHGDCHLGNVLWHAQSPHLIDFDDMMMGPPVQDVWLVVRGRDVEANRQRDVLCDGYEQMRDFDRTTLRLIEPLRALRMIHYAAWIARRYQDPAFQRAFPEFGSYRYWLSECEDLDNQIALLT